MVEVAAPERPPTAGSPGAGSPNGSSLQPYGTRDWREAFAAAIEENAERPTTAAHPKLEPSSTQLPEAPKATLPATEAPKRQCARGQLLKLVFLSSWGDAHYIGLTGIELHGQGAPAPCADLTVQCWADELPEACLIDGKAIELSAGALDAKPFKDVNALDGVGQIS